MLIVNSKRQDCYHFQILYKIFCYPKLFLSISVSSSYFIRSDYFTILRWRITIIAGDSLLERASSFIPTNVFLILVLASIYLNYSSSTHYIRIPYVLDLLIWSNWFFILDCITVYVSLFRHIV